MKSLTLKRNDYGNKRILAVFSPTASKEWSTISTLRELQQQKDVELHILFVLPRIPAQFYLVSDIERLDQKQWQEAQATLSQIGSMLHVPVERQWISRGSVTAESCWLANHLEADQVIGNNPFSKLHQFLHKLFTAKPSEPVGLPECKRHRLVSAR